MVEMTREFIRRRIVSGMRRSFTFRVVLEWVTNDVVRYMEFYLVGAVLEVVHGPKNYCIQ